MTHRGGAWHVTSADGAVGGVFATRDAARRFLTRELCAVEGRDWVEDPEDRVTFSADED